MLTDRNKDQSSFSNVVLTLSCQKQKEPGGGGQSSESGLAGVSTTFSDVVLSWQTSFDLANPSSDRICDGEYKFKRIPLLTSTSNCSVVLLHLLIQQ